MVDMSEDLDKKCCLMDEENDNDWEKLDNRQMSVQNKRNKKDDDDKDFRGSRFSKSSSVSEISLEEFARAIEKSSMKNENKIN
jgi:hypothetical protein